MRTIPKPTPSIRSTGAFSLIEMIGVLAIIAIVAAIMTPNLARRISRANGEKEEQVLSVLADGLIRAVRANQSIPGPTSWGTNISTQTGLPFNEVNYVNPAFTMLMFLPVISDLGRATGVCSCAGALISVL